MIPDEIWTGKECAAYLKMGTNHFMDKVRYRVGFPKPLEFNEGGRPRWYSAEIRKWALGERVAAFFTPSLHQIPENA